MLIMEAKNRYKTIQGIFQTVEQPYFPDISQLLTPFEDLG